MNNMTKEVMIKVVVFSSKLNNRPTIEVPENATKLDLKNALISAGIDYSGLAFADGMNSQELTGDSSVLTSKAGKALLTLSPKRNKAGGDLSFSELRNAVKSDLNLKNAFIERAAKLGKNWTQLRTEEMNEVYSNLKKETFISPIADAKRAVEMTPITHSKDVTYRGLSPEMKAEIKKYVNLLLLEKEELDFKSALASVEANFTNINSEDEEDEDDEY